MLIVNMIMIGTRLDIRDLFYRVLSSSWDVSLAILSRFGSLFFCYFCYTHLYIVTFHYSFMLLRYVLIRREDFLICLFVVSWCLARLVEAFMLYSRYWSIWIPFSVFQLLYKFCVPCCDLWKLHRIAGTTLLCHETNLFDGMFYVFWLTESYIYTHICVYSIYTLFVLRCSFIIHFNDLLVMFILFILFSCLFVLPSSIVSIYLSYYILLHFNYFFSLPLFFLLSLHFNFVIIEGLF